MSNSCNVKKSKSTSSKHNCFPCECTELQAWGRKSLIRTEQIQWVPHQSWQIWSDSIAGQWRGRRRRWRTACEQSAGMEAPYCGEISKFGHETSSSDFYACKSIVKLCLKGLIKHTCCSAQISIPAGNQMCVHHIPLI